MESVLGKKIIQQTNHLMHGQKKVKISWNGN